MKNENYYIEKTYTFLIQHGLENIIEETLKNAVQVVETQAGSGILILKSKKEK